MKFRNEKYLMGLKIRNIRKQKGYTQEKFCEIIDIDISGLSKIENGKCFPSIETIYKIMQKLNIFPNEIFGEKTSNDSIQDELIIEKIKQLSKKDKEKVMKIIEILKN